MRARLITVVVLWLVALQTSGCASSRYLPRPSHRLSFIQVGATSKLTRDGQTFNLLDLDKAVAGNPEAEAHARTYIRRTMGGAALNFAGLGLVLGGAWAFSGNPSQTHRDVGLGLVGGGLATIITGGILVATGQANFFDAVNIYNDGLPPDGGR